MGILDFLFKQNTSGVPVLRAKIIFDDKNNTSAELEKLHPDSPAYEYIKIVLHLYAKMLADLVPGDWNSVPASALLISGIENIAASEITRSSNILQLANIDNTIRFSVPKRKTYTYLATLYAISGTVRHIATDIPRDGTMQQGVFIVPSLIQEVLKFLDDRQIGVLKQSLRVMTKQYKNGFDYSDLKSWETVPNNAFFSGFTDSREVGRD